MAQFDVFANPNQRSNAEYPFLVEVQSNWIDTGRTVLVVALSASANTTAQPRLNVPVVVEGRRCVVLFQSLTAIDRAILGPPVARLPELRDQMMTAIDLLFLGF